MDETNRHAMKALVLLAVLWGMAGCVTGPPTEASGALATYETPRLGRHWMESDRREKPRRKDHVSDRGKHTSACKPAPVRSGHRGAASKGQPSKRS
jgi:hypothetical protein